MLDNLHAQPTDSGHKQDKPFDCAVLDAVHVICMKLWMREWEPHGKNTFPDPTHAFLIHTQVKEDGSLRLPHEGVTGFIARLTLDMV